MIGLLIDTVPGTLVRGCVTAALPAAAAVSDTGELLLARTLRGATCHDGSRRTEPVWPSLALQDTAHSAEQPTTQPGDLRRRTDFVRRPCVALQLLSSWRWKKGRGRECLFRCLQPSFSSLECKSRCTCNLTCLNLTYPVRRKHFSPPAILIPFLAKASTRVRMARLRDDTCGSTRLSKVVGGM